MTGKPETLPDLCSALTVVAARSAPQLAALARWLADRPEEIAFQSVRGLAAMAGSNAGTVVRLSQSLGFQGYEPLQTHVRSILRAQTAYGYGDRAEALLGKDMAELAVMMHRSARENLDALYSPAVEAQITLCADALMQARQVHCIGVRSCYSVAHYLSYTGALAFPNFQLTPSQPGLVLDTLSGTGPEDIVIAISYAHYSMEIVRGCGVAHETGARVIAMTDSHAAPVARGAWQVFRLPMAGPQLLPSLSAAFHLCERLLVALTARSPAAALRLRQTEQRLLRHGGYVGDERASHDPGQPRIPRARP